MDIEEFFVPDFWISLLSVGQLDSHRSTSTFKSGICTITNSSGNRVLSAILKEGLYVLAMDGSAHISEIRLLRTRNPNTLKIWHQRFAHLNYQDIRCILNPYDKQTTDPMDERPMIDPMDERPIMDPIDKQTEDPMDDKLMTNTMDNEPVTNSSDRSGKSRTTWRTLELYQTCVYTKQQ